jgi:cytochrome c551/c552
MKLNTMKLLNIYKLTITSIFSILLLNNVVAQDDPNAPPVDKAALRVAQEDDYYKIVTVPVPEGVLIEGGGLATLPDGRLVVATRRGHVWMIENPTAMDGTCNYKLFATGLHEPLGCTYKDGSIYIAQRGELTRLRDETGDGVADVYETVYAWPLSGHYHEYSYGPAVTPDGKMFVTGNVAFGDEQWWRGESRVPMRGWTMRISDDGTMEPWATGMRSPCGLGIIDGELFYNDNQGDWIGSGAIWHVKKGAFTGHPAGLEWTDKLKDSPLSMKADELYTVVSPRDERTKAGRSIKPENDEKVVPQTFYQLKEKFPNIQLPAVWLPHGILGISNAEMKVDNTGGKFGPFTGQIFMGDQGQSKIVRISMEKVDGEYQGVAFDFKNDFQSGILRMDWAHDGSLFVGQTNRGWGSAGPRNEGLQRLVWTGRIPFEMKDVKAKPDGFEIYFTKPVDKKSLTDLDNYNGASFIYKYHPVYGSPPIMRKDLKIAGIKPSADGMSVRVVVSNMVKYHIHELDLSGIKDANGLELLHPIAYYTLNNIPTGDKLALAELLKPSNVTKKKGKGSASTKNNIAQSKSVTTKATSLKTSSSNKPPTYSEVLPLLKKYTCIACHAPEKKQIGPSYKDIAKRAYSDDKIVQLIWKPQPSNWPDYATEMAAMPQVKKVDGLKIAAWINSL